MELSFSTKMDFMINLLQTQSQKQFHFPTFGPSQITPTQVPSSFPNPTQVAPIPAHKGNYHIKHTRTKKNIAMGQIVDVTPGILVHFRALVAAEAKVCVICVYEGEDTRNSFTDHLYNALVNKGFLTFRDKEGIHKGKSLKPELDKVIEQSRVSVIVFLKYYASSTWCLNELVMILDRKKTSGSGMMFCLSSTM
ncbi:hypothetical protein LguiB_021697 [Lonicera macranthoides]